MAFEVVFPEVDFAALIIAAAADKCFAIGAEGDRGDFALGLIEAPLQLSAGQVPELDGLISASRGQQLAVGVKGDAGDDAVMTGKDAHAVAWIVRIVFVIPDAHGPILTRRGQAI